MLRRVRRHRADEDVWFHFELDDEGWVTRHVELFGPDLTPRVAASMREWFIELEDGGIDSYQRRFGVLAEVVLSPADLLDWEPVEADEFERCWSRARSHLGAVAHLDAEGRGRGAGQAG
ncbi:hypothetical protein AB0M43_17525 [Longispora sp. NPDC051575]|uniref:hypothetical protein n=1 Tax=Longispora sp. NPDC051575 TaxID=3154943 RepID=UPI00342A4785